jgi:recombination protein RecT
VNTKQSAAQQQPLPERAQAPAQAGNAATQPSGTAIEPEKKIDRRLAATSAGTLSKFLNQNAATLGDFAKGFMKPEAMIRLSLMAFSKSPILAKCTLASILRSLMDAAALRVRPGGLNGRGYLVPRKNNKTNPPTWECHFDPGWRGLVDVARRSKMLKAIGAQVVREGDYFEYGYDPLPVLKWKPLRGLAQADSEGVIDKRQIIAAFAVAQLEGDAVQIEVLEGEDLAQIKKSSAAGDSGPWADWESEMCRKSAVKRLCKYLPVPDDFDDLDKAMAMSDGADTGNRVPIDVAYEEVQEIESDPDQATEIRGQLNTSTTRSAAAQLDDLESEAAEVARSAGARKA